MIDTKRKVKDTTVVYKMNVVTEEMLAVGEVDFTVGQKDYTITLFPDPEKQCKGIPSIKDAKAYYPNWFIEDGKGSYKNIEPTNDMKQVYLNIGFGVFPIGVISDYLTVQMFSSYEKMKRNQLK